MTTPLTRACLPEVRALLRAPEFAKDFATQLTDGWLEAMWRAGDFIAEAATGIWNAGQLVACGWVQTLPLADGTAQALVRLAVHPAHRRQGHGSAILEEIVRRLLAVNAAADSTPRISLLALFAVQPCEEAAAFAARHEFASVRFFHHMEREAQPVPEPAWPDGITTRTFDGSDAMLETWNAAYNVGFASHFRYTPGTVADCRQLAAAPGFETENVRIAFHDSQPIGLVRVDRHSRDGALCGEVEIIAVAPEHRGQGLGRALLRQALRDLLSHGCRRVQLMVDADSAAAPRLYASEGFTTIAVRRHWERPL